MTATKLEKYVLLIFIHHHQHNSILKTPWKEFFCVALSTGAQSLSSWNWKKKYSTSHRGAISEEKRSEAKWNENRYENEHMSNDIVLIPSFPFHWGGCDGNVMSWWSLSNWESDITWSFMLMKYSSGSYRQFSTCVAFKLTKKSIETFEAFWWKPQLGMLIGRFWVVNC